jgi:hypothetical protein
MVASDADAGLGPVVLLAIAAGQKASLTGG